MEIREFVAKALTEILEGVRDAQGSDGGLLVNAASGDARMDGRLFQGAYGVFTRVDFDLAVTAESKVERGGEAKLTVVGIGVGGKGGTATLTESVSRIAFSVPVQLPDGDQTKLEETREMLRKDKEEFYAQEAQRRAERESVKLL